MPDNWWDAVPHTLCLVLVCSQTTEIFLGSFAGNAPLQGTNVNEALGNIVVVNTFLTPNCSSLFVA